VPLGETCEAANASSSDTNRMIRSAGKLLSDVSIIIGRRGSEYHFTSIC